MVGMDAYGIPGNDIRPTANGSRSSLSVTFDMNGISPTHHLSVLLHTMPERGCTYLERSTLERPRLELGTNY